MHERHKRHTNIGLAVGAHHDGAARRRASKRDGDSNGRTEGSGTSLLEAKELGGELLAGLGDRLRGDVNATCARRQQLVVVGELVASDSNRC